MIPLNTAASRFLPCSNLHTPSSHSVDPPVITVPPQSIAADNGSNIEFSCTARGEGTLTFSWTTTALVGIPSSVQTQINPQDGSETSTLTLTNVGTNHSGEYACSVRNERGSTGPLQATLTIVGQFSVLCSNLLSSSIC